MDRAKQIQIAAFLVAALLGCASEKKNEEDDGGAADAAVAEQEGASVIVSLKNASTALLARAMSLGLDAGAPDSGDGYSIPGQSDPGDVQSLQYYIRSIDICEEMQISGSGYSGQTGCLNLYTSAGTDDYDTYRETEARADTTHYVDLMDPDSLQRLRTTVPLDASSVGAYRYGKIDWYMPIKVQAAVTLNDDSGTKLYTKDGTVRSEPCDNQTCYVNEIGDMTTPPAELAVAVMTNGGTWFKFQAPFEITEADIENQTVFELDLAFNPDNIIKGRSQNIESFHIWNNLYDPEVPAVIELPFLDLSPIFHHEDEQVAKESYLLHYTGDPAYDLRLELYALAGDPDRVIYAADLKLLLADDSTGGVGVAPRISFITSQDGKLTFEDYAHRPVIAGFTRLAGAGETGVASLGCGSGPELGFSCAPDSTVPYELSAVVELP